MDVSSNSAVVVGKGYEDNMNITNLCDKINLQPEIKSCIIEFANDFDFSTVACQLRDFHNYEKMSDALA